MQIFPSKSAALLLVVAATPSHAFHDCVQASRQMMAARQRRFGRTTAESQDTCNGGLCVGMHNGPHEGGPASYPVGTPATGITTLRSTMTVPKLPNATNYNGFTYYIWSDIFFGDMGLGAMNQFVPQLILGSALSNSSGPPDFKPQWTTHKTWTFGAHYFFEINGDHSNDAHEGHAAYGERYPTVEGETLYTSFEAVPTTGADFKWVLTMGVVGDATRVSVLEVPAPYMGLGKSWPEPYTTTSWAEKNYTRMCINSCWELYGATDPAHYPQSGSFYNMTITKGAGQTDFPWVQQWDEDEGANKSCAKSDIKTVQDDDSHQSVLWNITVPWAQ